MRWKFWQRQPDFFEEMPRAKRPRETLTQLSEKLIMKQMKQNAEYGLQIAEKVKKVAKVEDKTLLSQVKELRQIQTALRELGVGGEGEGQGILSGLFDRETIQTILATIIQALGKGQPLPPVEQPTLTQPERQQLTAPTDETIRMPSLSELLPYLEEEPQDIISMLKERQQAGDEQAILWMNLLSKSSYKQICQLLRPIEQQNPELETLIGQLLHESRESWWRELLDGVKRAV